MMDIKMNKNILTYLLKNFYLIYQINESINLDISHSESSKIFIKKGKKELADRNKIIKKKWNETNIYFLHNNTDLGEILHKNEDGTVTINYDIIASSFYLLSGKQELQKTEKDNFGRFTFKNSIQEKINFCTLPLVNYYFDILKTAIEIAYSTKIEFNHSYTATLTHDIDEVTSAWKHRARLLFHSKKRMASVKSIISHLIIPFTPWKNLNELVEFYEKNDIKSSFFFLTRDNKVGAIKNADYKIDSSYILHAMKEIKTNLHEIGIHGSYRTHDQSDQFIYEIEQIPVEINGGRFHFLQFDMQHSPRVIEKAKLQYDSTLGFQESVGFRNSICTPFYLYDYKKERAYDFLEIPLNVMDCTFAFQKYMDLPPTKSIEVISTLIAETKKFNGNLCVNWHNTFYSEYQNSEWKNFYHDLVILLMEENFIFLTCTELTKKYGDTD